MISYKDTTYCVQDTCTKRHRCETYLSKKIEHEAEAVGLPLSMTTFTYCFDPESKPDQEKNHC